VINAAKNEPWQKHVGKRNNVRLTLTCLANIS
jgi:hypothetical protein